jgi:perosamine synthetase
MPDMDRITAIAQRHNIAIVEDAAEALGSSYRGVKAGAFGECGVFSFHGTKTITTGEGGMFVTRSKELYGRALVLRDQGRDPRARQRLWNDELGYKFRMSGLCAAFGLGQVQRADELVERKREIFRWYQEELSGLPGVELNCEPPDTFNSVWMTTAVFDERLGVTKERAMEHFAAACIDTRPFFYPLSMLPPFADLPTVRGARERNPIAYDISSRAINLPSAMSLTREDVARVARATRELVG